MSGSFNVGGFNANVNAQLVNFSGDGSALISANPTATSVYSSGSQSMPTVGQGIASTLYVAFDTVLATSGAGMFSLTNPTRLTAPQAGFYIYSAGISTNTLPYSAGQLTLQVNVNSTTTYAQSAQAGQTSFNPSNSITTILYLNAGDYAQLNVYQSVGGTVTLLGGKSTYLSLALLRAT